MGESTGCIFFSLFLTTVTSDVFSDTECTCFCHDRWPSSRGSHFPLLKTNLYLENVVEHTIKIFLIDNDCQKRIDEIIFSWNSAHWWVHTKHDVTGVLCVSFLLLFFFLFLLVFSMKSRPAVGWLPHLGFHIIPLQGLWSTGPTITFPEEENN